MLATIETPELDQQLAAAQAKATASDALVLVAKSNAALAKLTYDRWQGTAPGRRLRARSGSRSRPTTSPPRPTSTPPKPRP